MLQQISKLNAQKNKEFPNFMDIYYKLNVDDNDKMLNVYKNVYDLAYQQLGDNISTLYDSQLTIIYCKLMLDKIYNCVTTNPTCGNLDVVWSEDIIFVQTKKGYDIKYSNIQREIDFDRYFTDLAKRNNKWILLPINVPNHSVTIIMYKNNDHYDVYFADPNGPMVNTVHSHLKDHINYVLQYFTNLCKNNQNLNMMSEYFLKNLKPQGNSIDFISKTGFCGGFTCMLIFFILINKDKTPQEIYQYIDFRYKQWKQSYNMTKNDNCYENIIIISNLLEKKKINIKINIQFIQNIVRYNNKFKFFEDELKDIDGNQIFELLNKYPNGRDIQGFKTLSEILDTYFQNKYISCKTMNRIISLIAKNIMQNKNLKIFRKILINVLNKNFNLNWFENHILMYLLFVKQFYKEHYPMIVDNHSIYIKK